MTNKKILETIPIVFMYGASQTLKLVINLYFYAPEIEDRGRGDILFLSCLSFCNSVLLSETFNLANNF